MNSLVNKISEFPIFPGVYLMKNEGGKIIYVGKAKNIRARVKQYFGKEALARYQIEFLMKRVTDIDYLITGTEKEALLLENSLIKKHKPRYNIFLKDDKSYVSLKINVGHPFPSLTVTRKIKKDGALYFGPYSSADACRQTTEFIYRYFMLRTCSDHEFSNRSRPCLEYQIKRCSAPCVGYVSKEEYQRQIDQVRLFLEGRNDQLLDELKSKMESASETTDFEEAARLRDLMSHISSTLEKQHVVHHGAREQDIVCLYSEGAKGIVALLHVREGSLVDSRAISMDVLDEPSDVMEAFLKQYYLGDVFIPDEILASPLPEDMGALQEILSEKKEKNISIRSPKKGDKKEMIELACRNAESQFGKWVKKNRETDEILSGVKDVLGMAEIPHRIECYDVSHISGKHATASRVVFVEGKADKNLYRHYKMQAPAEPNDYLMMKEVLGRRFKIPLFPPLKKGEDMSTPLPSRSS
ncbi:MAG TPA: excinuclease ABC subunit C [Deltaproteobacteria bacterium]|nr:excinuclease ABC subunit C [Deltaproteobacteria bacterium]